MEGRIACFRKHLRNIALTVRNAVAVRTDRACSEAGGAWALVNAMVLNCRDA